MVNHFKKLGNIREVTPAIHNVARKLKNSFFPHFRWKTLKNFVKFIAFFPFGYDCLKENEGIAQIRSIRKNEIAQNLISANVSEIGYNSILIVSK